MTTLSSHVIAEVGLCECHAVATTRVHHRGLPEVHAEGANLSAATSQLLNQLTRALDNVGSDYRRDAVEQAIEDVKDFLGHLPAEVTLSA